MVANYCKTKGIVLSDITKPEYVEKCLNKYGFKDWDSILAAVGHGALKESQIVNRLNEEHLKTKKAEVTDKDVLEEIVAAESKEKSKKKEGKGGIVVKGIHDVAVRFQSAVIRYLVMRLSDSLHEEEVYQFTEQTVLI